jgi:surface antigen
MSWRRWRGHAQRTLASSVFLAVSLLTAICAATVIGQSTTTSVASATGISYQSLGYPWEDATPLVNTPKDFEAGYTTCPNDDQNCFELKYNGYGESDPWGYYLRNCTSYVAWLLSQDGVPTKYFDFASYAKGDAESWLADAQSPQWSALNGATGSTPEDDAVAVSVPDDHVMFVTSTDPANSPPGDITVEEYNQNQGGPNAGEGDIRTDTPADLDITGYIYYGRYIPGPPTNPSPSPAPPTAKARWAGFEFRDSSEPDVAAAFGRWTVPTLKCYKTPSQQLSSAWVGIGGDTEVDYEAGKFEWLYQAGTQQDCVDGKPQYYAWLEEYDLARMYSQFALYCTPKVTAVRGPSKEPPCSVRPGDLMNASAIQDQQHVIVTISDTRGGKIIWQSPFDLAPPTPAISSDTDSHTGECVIEGPYAKPSAVLANFGQVTFSRCRASDRKGDLVGITDPSLPAGWKVSELAIEEPSGSATPSFPSLTINYVAPTASTTTKPPSLAAIVFDGSVGDASPPATLGPFTMQRFPARGALLRATNASVWGPTGAIGFQPALTGLEVANGWRTWSNGFTGDVYEASASVRSPLSSPGLTISLPPGTKAFYFYAEPNHWATFSITVTVQETASASRGWALQVAGEGGAEYFGFYSKNSTISAIYVSSQETYAVGEFGIFGQRGVSGST